MTIENFLVHPERGSNIRTDADLLAVRFSHRSENVLKPMNDDPSVVQCETFANVVVAEIKKGRCALNGPWTKPTDENMERVLRAIGCTEPAEIPAAARQLYKSGRWANELVTVRLLALGEKQDIGLPVALDQQITWTSVIEFCIKRFRSYRSQKSATVQWEPDGRQLQKLAKRKDIPAIREYFDLRPSLSPGSGRMDLDMR